jgi:hypothetical protein
MFYNTCLAEKMNASKTLSSPIRRPFCGGRYFFEMVQAAVCDARIERRINEKNVDFGTPDLFESPMPQ